MATTNSGYLLGIDIGTSTVKAVLVSKSEFKVVDESSISLGPHVTVPQQDAYEREVHEIIKSLEKCIKSLEPSMVENVAGIGVCGQMHGCVLWKSKGVCDENQQASQRDGDRGTTSFIMPIPPCSNFITWQDGRCTPEFLSSLPPTRQPIQLSAGYGCASLAWLSRFKPELIEQFDRAGTIMDLVVWSLCGHSREEGRKVVMSTQNATSWGYFDITEVKWELDVLEKSGFPVRLLPTVVNTPATAGHLHATWHGVPEGTPVGVAMGDMQCSILAAEPSLTDAVLNIGSASQLSVIKPKSKSLHLSIPPSLMEVPYFNGDTLLTAASLSGGNVMATFVKMLQSWMSSLGVRDAPEESAIYEKLISLANEKGPTRELDIDVTLWGERHDPEAAGAVLNVTPNNIHLGDVTLAMLKGVVKNLRKMMPTEIFKNLKISKLLGSGSALQRNPVLQTCTESVFGVPLTIVDGADAPKGAALAMKQLL